MGSANRGLTAQHLAAPFVLTDSITKVGSGYFFPYQSAMLDVTGRVAIQDVLDGKAPPFREISDTRHPPGTTLWYAVSLRNDGIRRRIDLLEFGSLRIDSLTTFLVSNGELLSTDRLFADPDLNNQLAISLGPSEHVTLYWRLVSTAPILEDLRCFLSLNRPESILVNNRIYFSLTHLYAGVMIGFLLVAFLLLGLFRERIFIFYALILLGFVFYCNGNIAYHSSLNLNKLFGDSISIQNLAILLIIAGFSGFLYDYLNVASFLLWVKVLFVAISSLAFVAALVCAILILYQPVTGVISNVTTFLWVLINLVIIIRQVVKKQKGATILLLFVLVLGSTALINTFYLAFFSVYGFPMQYSYFRVATAIFSGLLLASLFSRVTSIRVENTRLADRSNFITRFFTNISHEFRTPLTLMLGPVEQLLERDQDPEERELLATVKRNAERQLGLVNQILELSRLEATQLLLNARPADVVPVLRRTVASYESVADQRGIDLAFRTELEELVLSVETDKLETICYNLLTNAFKFTPDGGTISLSLQRDQETAVLRVQDTGSGIKATALAHIFDRFYSDDQQQYTATEGSGVGLALTRELVKLHGGEITVSSTEGEGTTFRISLPYAPGLVAGAVDEAPVKASEPNSLSAAEASALSPTQEVAPGAAPAKAPLVVVVEDNPNLQNFLASTLSPAYRVRVASNGRAGLALIEELMPDLVISDVMMPEMDGFEMCQTLKNRLAISHIPVILLTARSASEDRLAGLDTGADDYLTKPFHRKELIARARNLIESRKLLRERFAAAITLKPEEVSSTAVDQEFLRAAMRAVEQHMDREDFKVDALARELAMSRTSLNQKFRALLDQSTNQFIQSVRLERAADLLLKQQDLPVGEVAAQTGFGSTSYFVRCFREKFGETPGSFRKDEKA